MKRENREHSAEQTIDFTLLLQKVWQSRVIIVKIVAIWVVIGVIVALVTPKKYTAKSLLAPESARSANSLASAASVLGLGGINLEAESDALAVTIYPDIVASTPFVIELLQTPVQRVGGQVIPLSEYLQRSKEPTDTVAIDLFRLTKRQAQLVASVNRAVSISTDKKSGVTTVAVTLKDPQVAAMVARQLTQNLQKYVSAYRTSKAVREAEYWEQLYQKRKQEYYNAQKSYADYVDANRKVVLQSILNERERLQSEKLLAHQLYTTVATQMQMARAKVEEVKPVFTIIEPATTPLVASSTSRAMMVLRFAIVGVIVALLWVIWGHDVLKSIRK